MRILGLLMFVATLAGATTAGATVANDICLPSANPCIVAADVAVTPGSTLDFGARALQIASTGSLNAGSGSMVISAGSLVVQAGGRILTAGGDVDVTVAGVFQVLNGSKVGRIDTSGPDGGAITVTADGAIQIDGDLRADATGVTGDGNTIDLTGSTVTVGPLARLFARGGRTGFGDEISLTATGNITVGGELDASGGDSGGTITIDGGNFNFQASGVFDVQSGDGGSGAEIDISALGNVTLSGMIQGSAAGSEELGGGVGADVFIFATGDVLFNSAADLTGNGPDGEGGGVDIDTDGDITQGGSIVATADGGFGGDVFMQTTAGDVSVKDINTSGMEGGGAIEVRGNEVVNVTGKLIADGPGARILVTGCTVTVTATGSISSKGSNGSNTLLARGRLTVNGAVTAGAVNHVEYRNTALPPIVTVALVPTTTPVLNPSLPPCGPPPPPTTTTTVPTTTTTSTSSTTTTTSKPPTTTTTTTSTTTSTTPASTTTTSAPVTTTTSTTSTTTSTTPASTTTTSAPATTTTSTTTTSEPATTTTSTTSTTTSTIAGSTTTTSEPATTTTSTTSTTTSTTPASTTTTSVPATTTSTSTSTTTSTSAPSTSTSSSTTSTTIQPACDPGNPSACADGDSCTTDSCDPTLGCVHTPVKGVDAVTCRLGETLESLDSIPEGQLGGAQTKNRLTKRLARALRIMENVRTASGRVAVAGPKKARSLVNTIIRDLEHGIAKGKIDASTGQALLTQVRAVLENLQPLIKRR